ncbi:hypothetical protein NLU13_6561 [Sarocladium strictum]|uniref:histidine kinase n=1 Tax=Sarocladium strictum TaxID=5046 RepID=A0AA39GGQ8_SARSR|nr:hypothetical protein NLU13_6561 [Sarocladium strictum]
MISEASREREALRYEPSLLSDDFYYARDGALPDPGDLITANDPVLIALAQLGTFQTGAERALVSLFDSTHQYIVAEARPRMRTAPGLSNQHCPVKLSLSGAALPRHQTACEHVLKLPLDEGALVVNDLPLSIVPDLASDTRFTSLPYCQYGDGTQFYAGVPIRTPKGINIGTFCVMSEKQPVSWDHSCPQHLKDISHAIMHHLELRRSSFTSRRHERVNRGLSSFLEGKDTLTASLPDSNPTTLGLGASSLSGGGSMNSGQHCPPTEKVLPDDKGQPGLGDASRPEHFKDLDATPSPHVPPKSQASKSSALHQEAVQDKSFDTDDIFRRAANIIQEAFEVDGCAFVRAPLGSYRRLQRSQSVAEQDSRGLQDENRTAASASSSDDQQSDVSSDAQVPAPSEFIAHAAVGISAEHHTQNMKREGGLLPRNFLAKLLKRYPKGKVFLLDAAGEMQPSDSSEEDGSPYSVVTSAATQRATVPGSNLDSPSANPDRRDSVIGKSKASEVSVLHQAFPSARSIVFVPVWDAQRERWLSAGFVYTRAPNRVFPEQGELSLLDAFSRLIATEVLNTTTQQSDQAKSDALGSLSHELRSPLHGIILSTELLHDTKLSVFQGNATHTIETCCRTLVDTIDHLLDFSKVNSFAPRQLQSSLTTGRGRYKNHFPEQYFGKKSLYTHVRLDGLVEEVAASVFAGFNFQVSAQSRTAPNNNFPANTLASAPKEHKERPDLDKLRTMFEEQAIPTAKSGNTSIHVTIDPLDDWLFYTHPGAIRRLVMNLIGNSLKYTTAGIIQVSLSQEKPKRSTGERLVRLTVRDTGRGMGKDYLQHSLFKPFTQEDKLAPGTGLGLSLVKKITSQLRGQVSVESEVGVGTTVTITLPLEGVTQTTSIPVVASADDEAFEEHIRELKGLRVVVHGFGAQSSLKGSSIIEDICSRWLQMEVLKDGDKLPDLVIRSEDALLGSQEQDTDLAKVPNVVVCRDAPAAWRLFTAHQNAGKGQVFEFMSQPIGPRTLARSIVHAYRCWTDLPKLEPTSIPPVLSRSSSFGGQQLTTLILDPAQPLVDGQKCAVPYSQHHGMVRIKNELPASPQIIPRGPNTEEEKQHAASPETHDGPGHYLLVDDNHINLKVLSAYMTKMGQAYTTATNGKEAVDAYAEDPSRYVGILMDISMPVMDGLEATRWIRDHEHKNQLRSVPILALTGLSSHETHCEALESGVDVFLTKPVGLKMLREALQSLELPLSSTLPASSKPDPRSRY